MHLAADQRLTGNHPAPPPRLANYNQPPHSTPPPPHHLQSPTSFIPPPGFVIRLSFRLLGGNYEQLFEGPICKILKEDWYLLVKCVILGDFEEITATPSGYISDCSVFHPNSSRHPNYKTCFHFQCVYGQCFKLLLIQKS